MKQVFKEILAKCYGYWAKETILNFHETTSYFSSGLQSGYKAIHWDVGKNIKTSRQVIKKHWDFISICFYPNL